MDRPKQLRPIAVGAAVAGVVGLLAVTALMARPVSAAVPDGADAASATCSATFTRTGQRSDGYNGSVSVQNTGGADIESWSVSLTLPAGEQLSRVRRASASGASGTVVLTSLEGRSALKAGRRTTVSVRVNGGAGLPTVNGCTPAGAQPAPTPTPTASPTPSPTVTPAVIPSVTPTPTPTRTATPTVTPTASRTPTPTPTPTPTRTPTGGTTTGAPANSMGFIGCSMAENVAQGYVAQGGTRMWGPYGTGGLVVQSWTDPTSNAWQKFDQQVARYGRPTAVWVQICVFNANATAAEVKQLIANARQHAAPGAKIYITGQPQYDAGHTCSLAGATGPQLTDRLAREAGSDPGLDVVYAGAFRLRDGEDSDGCHANGAGQRSLGQQALKFWG